MSIMNSKKRIDLKSFCLILVLSLASVISVVSFRSGESFGVNEPTVYTQDIGNKLVTRCDLIKEYLSKSVRINELAARQNRVRGWEYVLRRLGNLNESYAKFNVNHSELGSNLSSLRQQLEQFKVDFEAYDSEFQRLLAINCKTNPQEFWRQLETLRSFRNGIALSVENYKASLSAVISKEDAKW